MVALIIYHAQRRFGRTKPFYIYSRAKVVWANKAVLYLLTRKGGLGEQSRFIKWSFCGEFINLYLQ
jgi:hypothetical protein